MKARNTRRRGIVRCAVERFEHRRDARARVARALHIAVLVLVAGGAMQRAPAKAQERQLLDTRVTQQSVADTICRPGYADTVSPSLDEIMAHKSRLLAARGIDPDDGMSYALDRRVPIVLGGSPNALANFDLLPWAGRNGERRKELVTARLKRCVCAGRMSLADAQAAIVGNWTSQYGQIARMSCDGGATDTDTAGRDDDGS
ncbi:hypothetical protein [Paraburkholderia caballeronis]|uniref:Uncharacterized protein n=1 Tax=Paraburkholderia caballeronis TaxID=416943 RepID=A0A1H7TNS4_9BURK|nr:hypothetical protein [Paraburkholderia caballeronis]PXW17576.1 hypothetical protein C7403_11713 [Paraburkholderia caballeronis]PXW95321.1 hypothetical protein C7407_11713 [Paraburkholderia caballeronis]RAJ91135.1 hypothetical protein C7409_11713 [Paraburkholderia caballeronis]TDV06754.1 hypothetical protein C7408_12213 [Paraburkholderia caballeronis]TDV09934.1 hypothetical protein C7406_12413 [Paraburkholderia caballeronis]